MKGWVPRSQDRGTRRPAAKWSPLVERCTKLMRALGLEDRPGRLFSRGCMGQIFRDHRRREI